MISHRRRLPAPTRTIAPCAPNRRQSAARALLIAAAAAVLLAFTLVAPALAANPLPRGATPGSFLHALPAKSTSPAGGALTGGFTPLVTGGNGETIQYYGGEVQHKPELEILWWGDNLFNGTQPFYEGVSLYTELKGFYDDLSNELEAPGEASWQSILSQYFGRSGSYGDAHVIAETDETAINAPQNLTVSNIKKEITTWANRGLGQNNNTQVTVVAAPGSSFAEDPEGGCAYHGIDEQGYSYTFLPYAGDLDHYFIKNKQELTCNSRQAGKEVETTKLMWSTTAAGSHEFAESESDPGLGGEYAWYTTKGEEVADLCVQEPIGSIELPEKNGRPGWWYVNELWDDGGGNTCKLEDPPYAEPSPPTATTEAATSIGYRQATLNGTLNPNGPEAHYDFEYGTTISYGSKIPTSEASAGYGTTTVGESAAVTGLKPGTKYHFRIVAKTYAGTTVGADKEFTTPIPPPAVTTDPAISVHDTRATLTGTVNPEEFSTTYQFEYWSTEKSGEITKIPVSGESIGSGTSSVRVSQTPTNLARSTEYSYRLVASNAGGTTRGSEVHFRTGPFLETQATPNPSGATESKMEGVACWSTTGCVGVGSDVNSSGTRVTLGENWNGSEWALGSTVVPSGATSSSLNSVSCSSAAACTAVGEYTNSSGVNVTLAERWNGTAWSVQSTPNPSGATFSSLRSVSCASATSCAAVGYSEASGQPTSTLAEIWNGTEWKIQTTINPTKELNFLFGVSCTSATACTAVGTTYASVIVERWNGTEWSSQSGVNEFELGTNILGDVSCTSATACTAVGSAREGVTGSLVSLAETWNGSTWSRKTTPTPSGAASSALGSVSCTSSTFCIASGYYTNSSGTKMMLADTWNGTEWRMINSPGPSLAKSSVLEGVACVSASCSMVGEYENGSGTRVSLAMIIGLPAVTSGSATNVTTTTATLNGVAVPNGMETTYEFEYGTTKAYGTKTPVPSAIVGKETEPENVSQSIASLLASTTYHYRLVATNADGTTDGAEEVFTTKPATWGVVATPNPSGATESKMEGVACWSTTGCVGVGSDVNSSGTRVTLGENWNGSEWALGSTVVPSGATSSSLNSVSCSSAAACTAVGEYTNSSGVDVTLVERWNGTAWSVQSTPNPSGAKSSLLRSVSCSSATSCVAVGYYDGTVFSTLAEIWNGTEWKVVATTNPSSFLDYLFGVSCTSPTACTGVGTTDASVIVERWNGTEWSTQTGVNEFEFGDNILGGVSCTGSTACRTAGSAHEGLSGPWTSLAETWNGSTWSRQTTPTPSGATASVLGSMSCVSSSSCVSTGYYANSSGTQVTLADTWNGTEWQVASTPNPVGAKSSALVAVSCVASTECVTVGNYVNSAGVTSTLSEVGP